MIRPSARKRECTSTSKAWAPQVPAPPLGGLAPRRLPTPPCSPFKFGCTQRTVGARVARSRGARVARTGTGETGHRQVWDPNKSGEGRAQVVGACG
jgi:hypothetical protein